MRDRGVFTVLIVFLFYLAILFVLVRPGSQGPTLVENVSNGLSQLIQSATGGGQWSSGSSK